MVDMKNKLGGLAILKKYVADLHPGINLLSALIESLNEEEIYAILNDEKIDCRIKERAYNRVVRDLHHKNFHHKMLINLWRRQSCSTDPIIRRKSSASLVHVVPYLTGDYSKIIISFLNDESPLIRRRGKNLISNIRSKFKQELIETLENIWSSYCDRFLATSVCEYARPEFLMEHFRELWGLGTNRLLFMRLWDSGYSILPELKQESPEDYLYYSAITHSDIPDAEVLKIIEENKSSERISLLLWSVGYMKKYDVLKELMKPEWTEWFEWGYRNADDERFLALTPTEV